MKVNLNSKRDLRSLIYEWNRDKQLFSLTPKPLRPPQILDETLRDGLQSNTVTDPTVEEKIALLRLMCALGIDAVNIGFAAAAPSIYEDALRLAEVIRDEKLPITPYCLARTLPSDIDPVIDITRKTGLTVHAFLFIGASPIRQFVEEWTVDTLVTRTRKAVSYSMKHGLPTMFFTEDTTRSQPEVLEALWKMAIECGATRIGLADTCGYANPHGARQLVQFARSVIARSGAPVEIDWHGHNDRGLDVSNSMSALEAGADRVHGCALGIGERVGNCNMEQLLVNLKLEDYAGFKERDLTKIREYVNVVSKGCNVPIPADYPVVGANAFRTSTGIHAAAVLKAQSMGGEWLADRVYSAVPAEELALGQVIEVGPQSGRCNVEHWLMNHGFSEHANNEALVDRILSTVKDEDRVLEEHEMRHVVHEVLREKKDERLLAS